MDNKSKIAETAFHLFVRNGYKGTSVSQLIEASGMSKGGFYHHFSSKKALYEFILDHYFLSFFREFDWKALDDQPLPALLAKFPEIAGAFLHEINRLTGQELSRYYLLFFDAYSTLPAFKETVQRYYHRFNATLTEKFKREKGLSPRQAEKESLNLLLRFEGLLFWLAVFPEERPDSHLNLLFT